MVSVNCTTYFPMERKMHITRPVADGDTRLFYRTVSKKTARPMNLRDPLNMVVQLRLYRWSASNDFQDCIQKDHLIQRLFSDVPDVTKVRVGRLLRDVLQYEPGFQRNPGKANGPVSTFWWRFQHPLELHYGVERLITSWLEDFNILVNPDDEPIDTEQRMMEELQCLVDQDPGDDIEFFMEEAINRSFELSMPVQESTRPKRRMGRRMINGKMKRVIINELDDE